MIKNIIRFKIVKLNIVKLNIVKMYCHSHSKTVFNPSNDNKLVNKINNIELKVDNISNNIIILKKQVNETHSLLSYLYLINIFCLPIIVMLR
jgi:hypothetical protein